MKTFSAYVEWDPETKLYVGIAPGIPGAHIDRRGQGQAVVGHAEHTARPGDGDAHQEDAIAETASGMGPGDRRAVRLGPRGSVKGHGGLRSRRQQHQGEQAQDQSKSATAWARAGAGPRLNGEDQDRDERLGGA